MPYLQNASNFLVVAIFSFALYVVLVRFWMQWVRADFRNEVGRFVINSTNPAIIPIRKIVPSIGLVDTATVILSLVIAFLMKTSSKFILGELASTSLLKLSSLALAIVLNYSIHVFIGAILIGAIASWINPHSYHPILSVARSLSDPIVAPARRIIPPISGIDFSPMAVLLFLGFTQRLLIAPLYGLNL